MRSDRKEAAITARLDERDFADPEVIEFLAEMDIGTLSSRLGTPGRSTQYATSVGWATGDGRPSVASDDPAVMQAIGRCAAARVRRERIPIASKLIDNAHPSACDWCDYPLNELIKACAWSVQQSGFVVGDVFIWEGKGGSIYSRPAGDLGYRNPKYRDLWALDKDARERRVEAATGRLRVAA